MNDWVIFGFEQICSILWRNFRSQMRHIIRNNFFCLHIFYTPFLQILICFVKTKLFHHRFDLSCVEISSIELAF